MEKVIAAIARKVEPVRGAHRFSEWLRRRYVRKYSGRADSWTVLEDYDGDLKLRVDRASYIGSQIYWHGKHSRKICRLIGAIIQPDWVVADVGANQGEITVFCAKRVRSGRVLSFEPIARLNRQLRENIALNGFGNVSVFELGLSDSDDEMEIFTSSESDTHGGENEGLGTLFRTSERAESAGRIQLKRLDDVVAAADVKRLDLVKIDVEGAELFVIKGGLDTFRRFKPRLLIEVNEACFQAAGYSTRDLVTVLSEAGYRLSLVSESGQTVPVATKDLPAFCDIYCE